MSFQSLIKYQPNNLYGSDEVSSQQLQQLLG